MKYVNLFIPGAAKSGTSTLHNLLDLHPEINMSSNKEPHFWADKDISNYTPDEVEAYYQLFKTNKKYTYYGESSTGYFYFENFKKNIKKYSSTSSKFILILRNPIDRTYSHYCYVKSLGSEDANLRTAILDNKEHEPSPNDVLPELIVKNYYQYSLYGKWLKKYYEAFDQEDIKIILFEELKEEPLKVLNECFSFLGLPPLDEVPNLVANKTVQTRFPKIYKNLRLVTLNKNKFRDIIKHFFPKKLRRKYKKKISETFLNLTKTRKTFPKLSEEDRLWLYELYKSDVTLLKKITGLSFDKWEDFNR